MKNLSDSDISYLKSIGYPDTDMKLINKSVKATIFTLWQETVNGYKGKIIKWDEVVAILGKEQALSGLARSTFHFSAIREINQYDYVYFDSGKLFR